VIVISWGSVGILTGYIEGAFNLDIYYGTVFSGGDSLCPCPRRDNCSCHWAGASTSIGWEVDVDAKRNKISCSVAEFRKHLLSKIKGFLPVEYEMYGSTKIGSNLNWLKEPTS